MVSHRALLSKQPLIYLKRCNNNYCARYILKATTNIFEKMKIPFTEICILLWKPLILGWDGVFKMCDLNARLSCVSSLGHSTAPASLTMEIKQSWSDTTPAPSPPLCLTDSKPPIEATGWKGAILHVAPFSALPCQSLCVFRMKRERRLGKYGSFWKGQVWYLTK